ncbi:MAG: tRNA 2-thiouridine(34) synthase MnmA [Clostridiales bacterium]|nr:tRNA 2-thiouridine(34) synthase MnmA [Clostridiales bacterium]
MKEKILVGMSGGVDSNVAVKTLLDAGYVVFGATLVMSDATSDAEAKKSAAFFGIEHITVDCRAEFEKYVIDNFVSEYLNARTPNPCVVCNRYVKFKFLCDTAEKMGIPHVSTGHYVGVKRDGERFYISKGSDTTKDQSYVLWNLTQKELSMLYFPLENKLKSETLSSAEKLGILPEDYGESQEICFIPSNDHAEFIEKRAGKSKPGNFIDDDGNVIGRHRGIINYTVGQRKGLGISLGRPAFVSEINCDENFVRVSNEDKLFKTEFSCSALNFQKLAPCDCGEYEFSVKIRYAAKPETCFVVISGERAHVTLAHPARAITSGQSAVFYDGDGIAFGGFID